MHWPLAEPKKPCRSAGPVDGEGFEPPKACRQLIYSQSPLATWVTVHLDCYEPLSARNRDLLSRRRTIPITSLQREPTTGIEPVTYHLQGGCSAD